MAEQNRTGLGRGLSSLIGDLDLGGAARRGPARPDMMAPIEKLRPNPLQPRRDFDEEALADLTRSVAEKGIIQPLVVRPDGDSSDSYMIVAGERRWRAAQRARMHEVPVLVRNLSDQESLEIALVENIQRSDLNPVEEAEAYRELMDRHGHTQEQLAQALGKSRSAVANHLRLLTLPEEVLKLVREGGFSAGHARALIGTADPLVLARKAINLRLSVRQVEDLVRKEATGQVAVTRKPSRDADTVRLEKKLSANLGARVKIDTGKTEGVGQLVISYRSIEHLDRLCAALDGAGMTMREPRAGTE